MTVSKVQILLKLWEMVPLAIEALRGMLENPGIPSAVRKSLIEMALQYGVGRVELSSMYVVF